MLPATMQNPAEILRLLGNIVRLGTVDAVDHAAARCRVESGGNLTGWLPWLAPRAGDGREWWPPSVGEQCIVLCPGGDPACGIVLIGLFSDAHPAPSTSTTEHRIEWPNGDYLMHDSATGSLQIVCSGPVTIVGSTVDLNP